jgi:hypothetical protein
MSSTPTLGKMYSPTKIQRVTPLNPAKLSAIARNLGREVSTITRPENTIERTQLEPHRGAYDANEEQILDYYTKGKPQGASLVAWNEFMGEETLDWGSRKYGQHTGVRTIAKSTEDGLVINLVTDESSPLTCQVRVS